MAVIEKEAFNQLVKFPGEVGSEQVSQLEALTKTYPYCQIAYSLLAKATAGSENLDQARPRAAAYALSRVALQKLVEGDTDRYDASAAIETTASETTGVEAIGEQVEEAVPQNSEDILISLVEQHASAVQQKSEEQRRQQLIIEGFMKKNPRISKQENNLEPIEIDLSGRVADSGAGSIETEAFARILVRQGKIEKAIDVYQKLILKKPEKRNYFAKKLSELYHHKYL